MKMPQGIFFFLLFLRNVGMERQVYLIPRAEFIFVKYFVL